VLKKVEEVFMSVALIGGMDRLVRGYITEAQLLLSPPKGWALISRFLQGL